MTPKKVLDRSNIITLIGIALTIIITVIGTTYTLSGTMSTMQKSISVMEDREKMAEAERKRQSEINQSVLVSLQKLESNFQRLEASVNTIVDRQSDEMRSEQRRVIDELKRRNDQFREVTKMKGKEKGRGLILPFFYGYFFSAGFSVFSRAPNFSLTSLRALSMLACCSGISL